MSNKVEISAVAALNETAMLVEHYRNRNLILAQENLTLRDDNAGLRARLDEITKRVEALQARSVPADGEAEVAVERTALEYPIGPGAEA